MLLRPLLISSAWAVKSIPSPLVTLQHAELAPAPSGASTTHLALSPVCDGS